MKKSFLPVCLSALMALSACQTVQTSSSIGPSGEVQAQIDQLIRLGNNMQASGDINSALGFYRKAYSLDTNNTESLFLVANATKAVGDLRSAEQLYANALAKTPDDTEVLRHYGNTLIEMDKLPQAIIQFNKALALSPGHAPSLSSLGIAHDMQGRHKDAQGYYEKSLSHDPVNLNTLNNYALSLALSGEYNKAIDQLKPYETDMTAPKRLRLNLALIYGLKGDMTNAANVAAHILDKEAVENNLRIYEELRGMSASARKKAVFGQ